MRGIKDERGQLFNQYIRVLKDKSPRFFVAENVAGILSKHHGDAFNDIINQFEKLGYTVAYKLLNAADYGVPQDRKRVIIVGMKNKQLFSFPHNIPASFVLKDALKDLPVSINDPLRWKGSYSPIYMARNRRRTWNQPSFTIMASGRQTPLHPDSSPMHKVDTDVWEFDDPTKAFRLSTHECARIQTFRDNFKFKSTTLDNVYKMIGNAVPVRFAEAIALALRDQL
jgi:DNA (cytosine-5)-methyltransferase 1